MTSIEQTSRTIKDSFNTRANTTENSNQQSDEKISQRIQNDSQQIETQLDQYQALLKSKLSRLKQINEQVLQHPSQTQKEIFQVVLESQLNLLETSEILKRISSK